VRPEEIIKEAGASNGAFESEAVERG